MVEIRWFQILFATVILAIWAFLMVLDGLSAAYAPPMWLHPVMLVAAGAVLGQAPLVAVLSNWLGRTPPPPPTPPEKETPDAAPADK